MSELIPLLWELADVEGSHDGPHDGGRNGVRAGARRGFASTPAVSGWPGVPPEFVPAFVRLHTGPPDGRSGIRDGAAPDRAAPHDGGWRTAQAHWEVVVARVLDTDVVNPNVSGELAIRRAVRASALLLNKMARSGRCPICPQPAMVSSR